MVCICRETIQKAKSSEFKLARVVSDNKKSFFKYVNSKKRYRENIGLVLIEDGHLTDRNRKAAESVKAFFASVFNNTERPWAAWSLESENHECGNSDS